MSEVSVFNTQDGSDSLLHHELGVSYHSKYGAVQESVHVFLKEGLRYRMPLLDKVLVFEMGFGTGLNALLTLIDAAQTGKSIDYFSIEAFPLSEEVAKSLNYGQFLENGQYEESFQRMHAGPWETWQNITPLFRLQKSRQTLLDAELPPNAFDVVYFDAFAPTSQPELWEQPVFERLYAAMRPNGVLVTYCAKGVVKRALKAAGFAVENPPGPPGKREMTRAIKQ